MKNSKYYIILLKKTKKNKRCVPKSVHVRVCYVLCSYEVNVCNAIRSNIYFMMFILSTLLSVNLSLC